MARGDNPVSDVALTVQDDHFRIIERVVPGHLDEALLRLAGLLHRAASEPAWTIDGLPGPGSLRIVAVGPVAPDVFEAALRRSLAGLAPGAGPAPHETAQFGGLGTLVKLPGQVGAACEPSPAQRW